MVAKDPIADMLTRIRNANTVYRGVSWRCQHLVLSTNLPLS